MNFTQLRLNAVHAHAPAPDGSRQHRRRERERRGFLRVGGSGGPRAGGQRRVRGSQRTRGYAGGPANSRSTGQRRWPEPPRGM